MIYLIIILAAAAILLVGLSIHLSGFGRFK